MSGETAKGSKGYVKTTIFFTTYDENIAKDLMDKIAKEFKVLESKRSRVLKEVYYIAVEGDARSVEDLLRGKVNWYKVDVLEFK